jgi:Sulfatase
MKRTLASFAALLLVPLSALPAADASATKPNIILLLADDLGYGSLGCYGNKEVLTPNIDALAASGMRFTDFHSNGALCSPTRAGGAVDNHTHLATHGTRELDWWNGRKLENEPGYSTDLLAKYATDLIARHKDAPFLLFLAPGAVHMNIMPVLKGQPLAVKRDLHWQPGTNWAVRSGPWKLTGNRNKPATLVNLQRDVAEAENLLAIEPVQADTLMKSHRLWL